MVIRYLFNHASKMEPGDAFIQEERRKRAVRNWAVALADDKNRQFSFDARDRPSRTNKNLTNNCITIISYVNLRAQMNGKPLAECRNVRKEKSRFCISAPDLST